jgi:branched-chain amino acid transport system permease protein
MNESGRSRLLGDQATVARGLRPGGMKRATIAVSVVVAIAIACLVLFLRLPAGDRNQALQAVVDGIMKGGVYALVALGVVVVYKSSKVFNLAHGAVLMLLAYFTWWLLAPTDLPLWLSLIIVGAAGVLIGLVIDRFLMRPMIGQSGLTTFILTMVLGFSVVQGIAVLLFGGDPRPMPPIFPSGRLTVGSITVQYPWLSAFVAAALMFLVFVTYFRYTRGGLAMRAVSEDPVVSQSLGIAVKRIFAISWVVGCLSAAAGGLLLCSMNPVHQDLGNFAIIRALPVVLLGGIESIPGAFVGALIIGVAEMLAITYIDPHVTGFSLLLPFILIVVVLIIRPHGLFGLREIRRI